MADERVVVQFTSAGQGMAHAMRQAKEATSKMHAALDRANTEFERFIERLNADYERFHLAELRAMVGGNRRDALDPLWQSAVCSAWLHEPCPDRGLGVLGCSCGCHR